MCLRQWCWPINSFFINIIIFKNRNLWKVCLQTQFLSVTKCSANNLREVELDFFVSDNLHHIGSSELWFAAVPKAHYWIIARSAREIWRSCHNKRRARARVLAARSPAGAKLVCRSRRFASRPPSRDFFSWRIFPRWMARRESQRSSPSGIIYQFRANALKYNKGPSI